MYSIVIVGYGEIARKAHTPAILGRRQEDWQIVALVDVRDMKELGGLLPAEIAHVPIYHNLQAAIDQHPECNVAAICTPQQFTLDLAFEAVRHGLHVLLEKPPGDYRRLPLLLEEAKKHYPPRTFFTAYHSSAPPGLPHIQEWIKTWAQRIISVHIEWRENVQKWHPGQQWVTTKEGLGVLDILFNPLSLLVHVMMTSDDNSLELVDAQLNRPSNWKSPISGQANMRAGAIPISAEFSWDYIADGTKDEPEEIWNITFVAVKSIDDTTTSSTSTMRIQDGGAQVYVDGNRATTEPTAEYMIGPEYVNLYEIFVMLMDEGRSYIDATTPRLIQEIMDKAEWQTVHEYKI